MSKRSNDHYKTFTGSASSGMKAIIFDFDGVIHDTFEFHRSKINKYCKTNLSEQNYKDIHNGNFFDNAPDELKNTDWIKYRDLIHHELSSLKTKKEIKATILKLNKKYKLYIVSSGGSNAILNYLIKNKISVFKEILGMESHRSKIEKFKFIFDKHNLTAKECVFITDTLGDILEANQVGIKTIAVSYGFHPKETLQKGKPHKIISSLNELLELLN